MESASRTRMESMGGAARAQQGAAQNVMIAAAFALAFAGVGLVSWLWTIR